MIKALGIVLIIFVSGMTGNYFAARLTARLIYLKKINIMLVETAILLRYKSATVYEIVEKLNSDERLKGLDFIGKAYEKTCTAAGVPFSEIWSESVEGFCTNASDTEFIRAVGCNLGTSDTDGQLSTIALEINELSSIIKYAENECSKKARLYRSLGVICGAFITLIIM